MILCIHECEKSELNAEPTITAAAFKLHPSNALSPEGAADIEGALDALEFIQELGTVGSLVGGAASSAARGGSEVWGAIDAAISEKLSEMTGPSIDDAREKIGRLKRNLRRFNGVEIWTNVGWKCCQCVSCTFGLRGTYRKWVKDSTDWQRCKEHGNLRGAGGGFDVNDKKGIRKAAKKCLEDARKAVPRRCDTLAN